MVEGSACIIVVVVMVLFHFFKGKKIPGCKVSFGKSNSAMSSKLTLINGCNS